MFPIQKFINNRNNERNHISKFCNYLERCFNAIYISNVFHDDILSYLIKLFHRRTWELIPFSLTKYILLKFSQGNVRVEGRSKGSKISLHNQSSVLISSLIVFSIDVSYPPTFPLRAIQGEFWFHRDFAFNNGFSCMVTNWRSTPASLNLYKVKNFHLSLHRHDSRQPPHSIRKYG